MQSLYKTAFIVSLSRLNLHLREELSKYNYFSHYKLFIFIMQTWATLFPTYMCVVAIDSDFCGS